jgi:hypothetical protein
VMMMNSRVLHGEHGHGHGTGKAWYEKNVVSILLQHELGMRI